MQDKKGNKLVLEIRQKGKQTEKDRPNEFCHDGLSLNVSRTKNFIFDKENYFWNASQKTLVCCLGYYSNLDQIKRKYLGQSPKLSQDVEIIDRLYKKYGKDLMGELEGIYLCLIVDFKKKEGYFLQSKFGFSQPLYYRETKKSIIFSTRLSEILKRPSCDKQLDILAAKEFIYFENIIPNQKTLVSGVKKMIPGDCLVFSLGNGDEKIKIKPQNLKEEKSSFSKATKEIANSVSSNYKNIVSKLKDEELCQTMTSGWDSTFLLYDLLERGKEGIGKRITAISINGRGATNEVPRVKKIIRENFPKVDLKTGKVPKNSFEDLPEIVGKYEGLIFQEGMFLRQELSKIVLENHIEKAVMGSCADQILFPQSKARSFIKRAKRILRILFRREKPEEKFRRKLGKYKKNEKLYVKLTYNLYMHELMMQSAGAQGIYPYINMETYKYSKALGIFNYRKTIYKKRLLEILPVSLSDKVAKSSEVVDTKNLFESFWEKHHSGIKKVFKSEIVKKIIGEKNIEKLIQKPEEHHLIILQILYIYFFDKIFLSGEAKQLLGDENGAFQIKEMKDLIK